MPPRGAGAAFPYSVELSLDALGCIAIIRFSSKLALAQLRDNGAGRRQAFAIDLGCLVPQLGTYDCLGAMKVDAFNVHDEHTARQLAIDGEALHQLLINRD